MIVVLRDELHITRTGLFDGVSLTASTRPAKTLETLRDKLRRGLALRAVQDIVGVRIVGDMSLSQQDGLRDELLRCLPKGRIDVDDRRAKPSFGYRAVHLIPHVEGFPIEMQIRTTFQDGWAQGSEKLGDVWGRWHRYGLPPEGPTEAERHRRGRFIDQYLRMGDAIYVHEIALDRIFRLQRQEQELAESAPADPTSAKPLNDLRDLLQEARQEAVATNRALATEVKRLIEISGLQSPT